MSEDKKEPQEADYGFKIVIQPQDRESYKDIEDYLNSNEACFYQFDYFGWLGANIARVMQKIGENVIRYQLWLINPDKKFDFLRKEYSKERQLTYITGNDGNEIKELAEKLPAKKIIVLSNIENLIESMNENIESFINE